MLVLNLLPENGPDLARFQTKTEQKQFIDIACQLTVNKFNRVLYKSFLNQCLPLQINSE